MSKENTTTADIATMNRNFNFGTALKERLKFDPELLRGWEREHITADEAGNAILSFPKDGTLHVAVHDGPFHADEILSVALLKLAAKADANCDIEVMRTRSVPLLAESDLVVDVGEGLLDHHGSRAVPGIAACSRVLALLYNTLVRDITREEEEWRVLGELVDRVAAVDTATALPATSPWPWIHEYSRFSEIPELRPEISLETIREKLMIEEETVFDHVVNMVFRDLSVKMLNLAVAKEARQAAEREMKNLLSDGRVASFSLASRGAEVKKMLWAAKSPAVYFVSPVKEEDWRVLCCANPEATEEEVAFSSQRLIPDRFRSLRGEELAKATGLSDAIFCHAAGFIAGFKTREAAEKFAVLCLED